MPHPSRWLATLLAVSLVACSQTGPARDADGFVPLFNGVDLDGWVEVLDSPWVVEDGVVSSAQNPDGRLEGESWLLTKQFYRDFTLRLEYRITPGGNSGVFVRTPVGWQERTAAEAGGPVPWDAGYEVNINNDHETYPTGAIWALHTAPPKLQREGEWNSLEITIVGQRISTWVNGQPAVQDAELPERPGADTGAIGFQRHGTAQYSDKLIEFRNVRIKKL